MHNEQWVIWHNPRCSKSRAALELLRERGLDLHVVEYLKSPPSRAEIKSVLGKLAIPAEALVRKGEDVYRDQFKDRTMTADQWLDALAAHPVLIERPVIIRGGRAVLGRPPENALELV